MESNKLNINNSNKTIGSPRGVVPYFNKPEHFPLNSAKIRCAKTVTLAPNSVHFITAKIDSHKKCANKSYRVLFEPYMNMAAKTGIIPAGSISYTSGGTIPIQCIQTQDEPVTLYKRQLLGFVKPVRMQNTIHSINAIHSPSPTCNSYPNYNSNTQSSSPSNCNNAKQWTKPALITALSIPDLDIPEEHKERLSNIVWDYRDCFSVDKFDLGKCTTYKAKIDLKQDYVAKWIPSRPVPYKLQSEMDNEIKGLLRAGVIEPCNVNSKWNSQIFLVEKNQPGKYRFVVDMRAVNTQCLPDSYELTNINHVLDKVGRCKYWTSLDFSQSFHQIEYEEDFKPITAFIYKGLRYMFARMVMGHRNSSSNFSRMMDKLLLTLPIDTLCYFLDDLLLASHDIPEHLDKLELLLNKFRFANLKLSPSKCHLISKQVDFVGITINQNGISINEDRVKAITCLEPPTTRKELMSVLGVFSYNRKFISKFSDKAKPMYDLLKKENRNRFSWDDACQVSFDTLKSDITTAPVLAIPDVDDPLKSYQLHVDASGSGYGAMLTQLISGERRIVAYYSKSLPPRKRKLGACKLEFLCMHSAILHFRQYLKGSEFIVVSDCKALINLSTLFSDANTHMQRKIADLADYNFEIQWTAGQNNIIPDFLSRYHIKTTYKTAQTQTNPDLSCAITHSNPILPRGNDLKGHKDSEYIPDNFFSLDNPYLKESTVTHQVNTVLQSETINSSTTCICKDIPEQHDHKHPQVQHRNNNTYTGVNNVSLDQSPIEVLSNADIGTHQSKDIILKEVIHWVKAGKKPTVFQAHQAPQELKTLWKSFKLLLIHNGLLCRKWVDATSEVDKLLIVIPNSLQVRALQMFHDSNELIHAGAEVCLQRCRKLYWWPQMKTDFELYISACIRCNSIKQPKKYLKAPLQCIMYSHFNQAICIDHIVPEATASTPRNFRYILTVVDMWSGFVMALPTRGQTSAETIKLLMKHWVNTFGLFQEILHDNAPGFSSDFFKSVLKTFNIKNTRGTTYKSATTGKVERSNKKINSALRAALPENELHNWDLYLGIVCLTLNSIKNRHTNYSPYFLVFGREPTFPSQLMVCNEEPVLTDQHTKMSTQRKQAFDSYRKMKNLIHRVREHAQRAFQYTLGSSSAEIKGPFFEEGDHCFVLVNCPKHKFGKRWHGPYKIKRKINDHLYVLPIGGVDKVTNISKLKPYKHNKYSPKEATSLQDSRVTNNACSTNPAVDQSLDSVTQLEETGITITVSTESNDPDYYPPVTHHDQARAWPIPIYPLPTTTGHNTQPQSIPITRPDTPPTQDDIIEDITHMLPTEVEVEQPFAVDDAEMPGSSQANNDIIFHPVDPPNSRPSRNRSPIDRLSYPQTHLRDQRCKYLKKYNNRQR